MGVTHYNGNERLATKLEFEVPHFITWFVGRIQQKNKQGCELLWNNVDKY